MNTNQLTSRSANYISYSGAGMVKIVFDGLPTAPTISGTSSELSRVTLSWAAPASPLTITDYVIQYRLGSSGSWSTFSDGTSGTPGAVVTGLSVGSAYQFQVAAVTSDGTGPYSSPVSVTVNPDFPATFATAADVPLTINGLTATGAALTLNLGFAPGPLQKLTLVNNTGTNAITGTFTGLAQNGTVTGTYNGDTFTFQINYSGGTGNDITLMRVGGPGQTDIIRVSTLAGSTAGFTNATGPAAQFNNLQNVALDSAGNLYVADYGNHQIRKVTPAGVVTTLAGTNTPGTTDGTGSAARFNGPAGVAVDASGNVYVADRNNYRIRKVTPAGVVTTLAGNTNGFADATGTSALFNVVTGVAVDAAGNVYVADPNNHRIRKVTSAGVVTTLAGTNTTGTTDATGSAARFSGPHGVAVDSAGNVYVTEVGNARVRKVTPAGVVTTLAGSTSGFADGTGSAAQFGLPSGMAVDSAGNVYVADYSNHRIRKVTQAGVVTTLAGSTAGATDGTGSAAQLSSPTGLALDSAGNFYVGDSGNHRVRKITADFRPILTLGASSQGVSGLSLNGTVNPNGYVTTARFEYGTNATNLNLFTNLALSPSNGTTAQNVTALFGTNLPVGTYYYRLIASNVDGSVNSATNSFIQLPRWDNAGAVTFATAATVPVTAPGLVIRGATLNPTLGFLPRPGTALTLVNNTSAMAIDGTFNGLAEGGIVGLTYNGDTFKFKISYVGGDGNDITLVRTGGQAQIFTLTGSAAGSDNGASAVAKLSNPLGVVVDRNGNTYVADTANHQIRKITEDGTVSVLAGSTQGYQNATGSAAQFNGPQGVAVDTAGNLYVADTANSRIRKITPAGVVTLLAGSGTPGNTDGTGAAASFNLPQALTVDAAGNVYVSDTGNHRIRKITSAGVVTTLAGSTQGYLEGTGTAARFNTPNGIVVDAAGNVYVADTNNARIRKISPAGLVTTFVDATGGLGSNFGGSSSTGNMIRNGDFSDGTNSFTSEYAYVAPVSSALNPEGKWSIVSAGRDVHNAFSTAYDHTLGTSSGKFFAGNGAPNTNQTVWRSSPMTILEANTPYRFEAWVTTLVSVSGSNVGPSLSFEIGDGNNWTPLGTSVNFTSANTAGSWVFTYADGSFGQPGIYYLRLRNAQAGAMGNDFGIDDIFFGVRSTSPSYATVPGAANPPTYNVSGLSGIYLPVGLALDSSGNLYVSDAANSKIRRVTPSGTVSVFAGSTAGFADGAANIARFSLPAGLAFDAGDSLYIADAGNHRIRKSTFDFRASAGISAVTQTPTGAVVTGLVNPNGLNTVARIEYGTSPSYGLTSNITLSPINGEADQNFTNTLAPLTPGLTYYYRLYSTNADGVSFFEGSFVRNDYSPVLTLGPATLTSAGAQLTGTVNPQGLATTARFEYGTTTNFGSASVVNFSPNNGTNAVPVTNNLTGLTAGATYHYRLSATNADGGRVTQTGTFQRPAEWNVDPVSFATATNVPATSTGLVIPAATALNLQLGFAPASGTILTVLNNTGSSPVFGTFDGLAEGATVSATQGGDTFHFRLSYQGGDGNDITLTRIGGPGQVENVIVSTLAGGGSYGNSSGSSNGTGSAALFYYPYGVAVDRDGNVYVTDTYNHQIRKITPAGVVTTLAGSTSSGTANGTGTSARFNRPAGITLDASGNVYVADQYNNLIRKISPTGVVTTLAGSGSYGSGNGTGTAASFAYPSGVGVDSQGNVYIGDSLYSIRKITPVGVVTTLAGGSYGSTDGTGLAARFSGPKGIALDGAGNLYVAEDSDRIRKITPAGVVTTFAGSSYGLVDGPALSAKFYRPNGVTFDALGNLYVADTFNHRIRKIAPDGTVSTLAGSGTYGGMVDGPGNIAQFSSPSGIASGADGALYVADNGNNKIRKITSDYRPILTLGAPVQTGTNMSLPGTVNPNGFLTTARFEYGTNATNLNLTSPVALSPANGTNAQAVNALLTNGITMQIPYTYRLTASNVDGTAVTTNGTFILRLPQTITFGALPAKTYGDPEFAVTPPNSDVPNQSYLIALTSSDSNVVAVGGYSSSPTLIVRGAGTAVITARHPGSTTLAPAEASQSITVAKRALTARAVDYSAFAGQTLPAFRISYSGFTPSDDASVLDVAPILSTTATASSPAGTYPLTLTSSTDNNYTVSTANGTLTLVAAGGPFPVFSRFDAPVVATNYTASGNLNFTLGYAPRPYEVLPLVDNRGTNAITGTFSGRAEGARVSASFGPDTFEFELSYQGGDGNDITLTRLPKSGQTAGYTRGDIPEDPKEFWVTTLAGSGSAGFSEGAGPDARFNDPHGLLLEPNGGLLVADRGANRILRVGTFGRVTSFAGSGASASTDGPAATAGIRGPVDLARDASNNLYVLQNSEPGIWYSDVRIRKITPTGAVTTLAGGASGYQDGSGTNAKFSASTVTLVADSAGNLFVADTGNHRIRKITPAGVVSTFAGSGSFSGTNNGTGTAAILASPTGIAIDNADNLYVSDFNGKLRIISPAGVVTTETSERTVSYYSGWDASNATFRYSSVEAFWGSFAASGYAPRMVFDASTNVYTSNAILSLSPNSFRRYLPTNLAETNLIGVGALRAKRGSYDLFTGNTNQAFSDGLLATDVYRSTNNVSWRQLDPRATFSGSLRGLARDRFGNIYISDAGNKRIRKLSPGVFRPISPSYNSFPELLAQSPNPGEYSLDYRTYRSVSSVVRSNGYFTTGSYELYERASNGIYNLLTTLPATNTWQTNFSAFYTGLAPGAYASALVISNVDGIVHSGLQANFNVVALPSPKTNQTITFAPLTNRIYGEAPFTLGATSSSGLPITYVSGNPSIVSISGDQATILGAGTVNLTARQPGNSTYNAAPEVSQSLTVLKRPLTVIANNTNRFFGQPNGSFSVSFSGFAPGDNAGNSVSGAAGYRTSSGAFPSATTTPGTYDLIPELGSLASSKYDFILETNTPASFTINPAPVLITLGNLSPTFQVSGGTPVQQAVSVTTQPAGLNHSVMYTGINGSLYGPSSTPPTDPGQYQVVVNVADTSYAGSTTNTLTIGKATQTLTLSGLLSSVPLKDLTNALSITAVSSAGLPVNISLEPDSAQATLNSVTNSGAGTLSNFAQTGTVKLKISATGTEFYHAASTVVTMDVTLAAQTITFNQDLSNLTYSNGLTVNLTGTSSSGLDLTYSSSNTNVATVSSNVLSITGAGTVSVEATQAGNSVYDAATPVTQTFTVAKAAAPALGFSLTGLNTVYGQGTVDLSSYVTAAPVGVSRTFEVISGPATISGTTLTITGAGPILIRASQPENDNYLGATAMDQTLNVARATLHITAVSTNRPAGQANPVFAVTYSNLVAGDTAASLASPAVVTTLADETSSAGTYPLEVDGAGSDNYDIFFVDGVLTVTKANPAISWDLTGADTITYGTALGTSQLNATAPVAGTFNYSPASGSILPAGTNQVVATFTPTDTSSYETISVTNNIIVNKATVLVVANAQTKYAGQSDPELTYSALGLVGSDTFSGALGRPSGETPGTYAISQGTLEVAGGAAGNYTIQFTPANLTILVDSLGLISAYDGSQTGSAIPALVNYTDLGITGVTSSNLLAINSAIARLDAAVTDSVEEIQAVVNAFGQILAGADGDASTPPGGLNLSAGIYQTVGVVLGDIATNANNLFLFNSIISSRSVGDVDSAQELDTLADVVNRLQDYAADTPPTPAVTMGDLGLIGVSLSGLTNLTSDLAPFYSALEATADDGSGLLTVAAVQALLTSYEKILAEANGASADATAQDPLPSDYTAIGVNLGTIGNVGYGLDLLNDLVAGLAKTAVDTIPELNALASVIDRILITVAGGTASPALTDADFTLIGISGVTADNLGAVLAVLAGTADNGEEVASIAALQGVVDGASDALGKISQYDTGDSGADVPTAATYLAAGVTGVDAGNLAAINTALAELAPSASDSREEVQAAVDAYLKILGEANGAIADATPSANPTAGDYAAIGVDLGATATNASGLSLLNEVIGGKSTTDVDTVAELQALADVVDKILATVAGSTPSPALTDAELALIGLTGVTANNLNDILAALAGTDDNGSGAASVAQLQTLVDGVNSGYASNALAIISAYQPPTVTVVPTVSDYTEAGVSGVNLANLATFNSAMAVLGSSATDTTAEVQAVVNTYFKILAEANGAAADPDPSANPTVTDYQTIGVTLGGLAGSLSGFSLFSDVVGASEYEDIDTVPELDALASVADRLLTVAGGGVASPALTAADLALIGITGVTSGNLADVLLAVGATADDGSSISTLAGLQAVVDTMVNALAIISAYDGSQTGSGVPSLQTFTDAQVYGVTAGNLPSVHSALERLASGATDTSAEIQAVVSGYARILAEANGLQPDAYGYSNPAAEDYLALGVPLGSLAVNLNGLFLLNEVVGTKITTEVDTVTELDALASAVDRLMQTAGGQSFTPPLAAADFVLIGITGVNSSNLAAVLTAIGGTADDGSAIDTLAELQTVVTNAAQAFGASALPIIASYDGTGGTTVPDENHYGAAGVNGVTAGNVAAINTAIGPLPSSATDSSAEIQAVVDAYLAILDEANGSLADANASANPSSTDYQTIGVNLGAAATNVNGLDLLNTVVGAKEDAGVDTVSEIQGLATAVDGLLTLAGGGTPSPAVDEATLGNLGISGATSGNLTSILSAITASPDNGSGIASLAQLQAVVDGYAAILGAADGTDDNDTKPTAGDYAAVQITGIDTSGEVSLLGDVVDEKNSSAVDTVAELQTLADAVQAVLGGTPSQAQLEALLGTGTGLTSGNLPAVQAAIAAAAPAGADTLAELATLVDGVVNAGTLALNRIRDAAQNNTAAGTNPSATDFATAGVTGVDVTNLAAIQSALNDADVIGTSADTTVKIQGIVDAYLAILGAADGSADGDTAPTAVEYGLIGVNGVSGASAVALLGNVIDGKTGVDVDTVTEVQGLADFVAAVMNGAAGTANQPSLADLQGLGISGVNSTNLAAVQAAIAATANDGSDVDSLAKLQAVVNSGVNSGNALAVISGAADANNATDNTSSGRPNLSDYATAGVTGVDATNLPAINSALNTGGVDAAKADTTAEVQAIVDAYLAILGVADGTAGNGTAPTAAQYSDIGVTGVTAGASADLLGNVLDGSASTAVDTVVEIQALADAVAGVMAGAAGTANEPTLADLTALGITGVDSTNLALIQAAIAATADNGSDVDSLSKLQTLVDGVLSSISSALATISGAAENDNATSTSLAASVYESAAVTGVDVTNVGAINSVLDLASVNGAAVNTTAEIQAIVDAYQAILGAADGSADGDPAPTGVQYAQIGVTGVATAEAVSLLGEVIDAKSGGDVDSVTEVQNLADAVAGVLAGAGGTANEPTLADLTDLGFSSVNSSNLADVQAAIAAAGVAGVDTLSELQSVIDSVVGVGNALAAIADAAENNTAVSGGLTVAVYTAAGVTGVDANNVAAINSALDSALVTGADTTTTADVQAIVDAYVAVLGLANGSGGTNPGNFPAASAYGSLGVSGVTAGASADLLGSVIDEKLGTDVDTVAELQDLADAVKAVLDYASGASATAPTLSELQLLGVTGLSAGQTLDGYLAALLAGGSNGADSLAELNAVEVWVPVEVNITGMTEATAPATGVTTAFVGTAGQEYRVSATSSLNSPISWSILGTTHTAHASTGVLSIVDPNAVPTTITLDGYSETVLRRFYKFEIRIR